MARARTGKLKRVVRHKRVRKKVSGTTQRPRLAVFRSLQHVYAQVIDDDQGTTVAAASSLEKEVRGNAKGPKAEVSKAVGKLVAQRAKEKGIKAVVFDRGGYKYHGRIKTLADAAREEGLEF